MPQKSMAKDTFLNRKRTLNSKGQLLEIAKPWVMAILNLTPDSFYTESRNTSVEAALQSVETFLSEGADCIDLGAYSSRPGAIDIPVQEELDRLIPVIKAIKEKFPEAILSIDTFRSEVAEAAIHAGAHIINDISAGTLDPNMFAMVARLQVPYIMMHMKGTPQDMKAQAEYDNIELELIDYFSEKIAQLRALGVKDIILDPGFGFAKTTAHNYELLSRLEDFKIFELPILVGVSRKSMVYLPLESNAAEALNGTTVLHTIALMKGANILRVHDVKEARECITLIEKLGQYA